MSVQIGKPGLRLDIGKLVTIADNALEHQDRIRSDDAQTDLWGHDKHPIPETAVLVLIHRVFFQIDHFDQAIWFNSTQDRDELWVSTEYLSGIESALKEVPAAARDALVKDRFRACARTLSVMRYGSFDESLIDLLCCFFSTPAGSPTGLKDLIATGYVSMPQVRLLFQRVNVSDDREKQQRDLMTKRAREKETEIIRVARELGLRPEPAGTGPIQWYANCPGKGHHRLMITTSKDQFGCGYCKVNGGVGELKGFAEQRSGHVHHA